MQMIAICQQRNFMNALNRALRLNTLDLRQSVRSTFKSRVGPQLRVLRQKAVFLSSVLKKQSTETNALISSAKSNWDFPLLTWNHPFNLPHHDL